MELSNSAQNKRFTAVEGTSVDKKFVARDFYVGKEQPAPSFEGGKSFLSKIFGTGKFARADAAANAKGKVAPAYARAEFKTNQSSLVRKSSLADQKMKVRDYPDNRPFLAQGTRQKILDQERAEHPLSIDEVRELLNKSR